MITRERSEYHITVERAKKHLRIDADFTDDDEYISDLIEAATIAAENWIEKSIALATCTVKLNDYTGSMIYIPDGNYISITSITDQDTNTYTPETVHIYHDHFILELNNEIEAETLTIVYQAGYEAGKCPADIKQALLIKIDDLYSTERGSYTMTLQNNRTFENLLQYYKPYRFNYYRTT